MQFRQRSQKNFANFRKFFGQSLKKTKKIFPLWSLFLLKKFLWTARMQIWQPCRNVFYKSQKRFSSRSEFEKKAISFSKTCSSLKKRFFGHVKCSFDTSHETFWPQALKKSLSPKFTEKNTYFKKKFKTILRAHWKQFWQTLVFAKSPRMTEKVLKPQKNILKIFFGQFLCSLGNAAEKISRFPNVFVSKSERFFFQKKTLFSKCSPGLLQRQFGHPTKKFLLKIPEMFDPNPKNMEKIFFEKNPFSFKTILSAQWKQFWQTLRFVFAKSPKEIK